MKQLIHNVYFKIGTIAFIAILLMLPSSMIMQLIQEREGIQKQAIWEVSSKWGNAQTITGPVLTIPYDRYVTKKTGEGKNEKEETYKITEYMHFLPKELIIDGSILPKKKNRSIYEIVLYKSTYKISGVFDEIDYKNFEIKKENVHFDKATINIGISDLKGIEKQIELNWENEKSFFNPGTATKDIISSGINCPVNILADEYEKNYKFNLTIDLKGSQNMNFIPVGKSTKVDLKSNWANPSFGGNYLPDPSNVTPKGFEASWNIFHLNRNYPQAWIGSQYNVESSSFGVDLLLPVNNYLKNTRVAKYAFMLIALTFMVFFFVEVIQKVFIHPIQYILVGTALIVFYTLLLSFSEHILFNYAYILSAFLTISLVSWYVKAILKMWNLTLLITGIMLILYTFIFILIQVQDYALLFGSIGIFLILTLVMYFSKKIDWGQLKVNNKKEVKSSVKEDAQNYHSS